MGKSFYEINCKSAEVENVFIPIGSILSVPEFDENMANVIAHLSPSTAQRDAADAAVSMMFGSCYRKKNGTLKIAAGHNYLCWYQFALVYLDEFKSKWSSYVDFETGKRLVDKHGKTI